MSHKLYVQHVCLVKCSVRWFQITKSSILSAAVLFFQVVSWVGVSGKVPVPESFIKQQLLHSSIKCIALKTQCQCKICSTKTSKCQVNTTILDE